MQFCADIGMFVQNRSKKASCIPTEFCARTCYYNKFQMWDVDRADPRYEEEWRLLSHSTFGEELGRKRNATSRFRFASKGEVLGTWEDLAKVGSIVRHNPEIQFWIPTRGWRKKEIRQGIQQMDLAYPNLFTQASIDPSNTGEEIEMLLRNGWSLMFYGNDERPPMTHTVIWTKCPKTWEGKKGHCIKCRYGCFKRRHIWLKQH